MSLPPFLGVFLITIFVSGPIQWSYLMLHVVFLSAIMEQTTESEDDSLQTACIHIIFNRPEVFCNTAVSDSVCLCFCKGSYWTGSLEIPKYTKMYPTLGNRHWAQKEFWPLVHKYLGLQELFVRYCCGLTAAGSSAPHNCLLSLLQQDEGENWKYESERNHELAKYNLIG